MLEDLVANLDAWAKAEKQKKGQQPIGKPPVRQPVRPGIQPLPHPRMPDHLRPQLREGDLGPGVPIPRQPMIPPTLPPAQTQPGRAGPPAVIGPQPTRPTNPPPLRATPFRPPVTGQPNAPATTDGRATPPATGDAATMERIRQLEAQIEENERQAAELQNKLGKGKGPADRGQPNARGTLPYYQGRGPTKKFAHEQYLEHVEDMRQQYPHWFLPGGRAKQMPPGLRWDDGSPVDQTDYIAFGGEAPMSATERKQFEAQQKLQMQQARPDLYGPPGTPFRPPRNPSPRMRGANPPRGYQQQAPPPSGPFGANQRALDSLNRFRNSVPPPVQPGGATAPAPQQPTARRRR